MITTPTLNDDERDEIIDRFKLADILYQQSDCIDDPVLKINLQVSAQVTTAMALYDLGFGEIV